MIEKEFIDEKIKEISRLVLEKNKQYGDIARKTGRILELLYGDAEPDMHYMTLMVRILDKLGRISQGHFEDSFEDIIGYCLIGLSMVRDDETVKNAIDDNNYVPPEKNWLNEIIGDNL